MNATLISNRRKTYAYGEPQSGGMPTCVVEISLSGDRVNVRVLHREGNAANLGTINRRDGKGDKQIATKDEYFLEAINGVEPLEILKRASTRNGWREVTTEQPWWDGLQFVKPII